MPLLYITADSISAPSGGGLVTAQEHLALQTFSQQRLQSTKNPVYSSVIVLSRANLVSDRPEPWKWDWQAAWALSHYREAPNLAHFYSGTWPETMAYLKAKGVKTVITIAAHDREVSRREHEKLGWPFPYPHLIEPKLWQKYIEGYRLADIIVCPSTVAANTVRAYGPEFEKKDIRIIPHGCFLPKEVKPLPKTFIVGHMGSFGADKGVRYLLEAWRTLNYKDGSLLLLAGKDSTSPMARHLLEKYGGGNVQLAGWQENTSNFYNSISCYVQPSCTEGWGIEVVEAAAHGRPVICSENAGAVDFVRDTRPSHGAVGSIIRACDSDHIATLIKSAKQQQELLPEIGLQAQELAKLYTWDKVRQQYQDLWAEVLG